MLINDDMDLNIKLKCDMYKWINSRVQSLFTTISIIAGVWIIQKHNEHSTQPYDVHQFLKESTYILWKLL